MSFLNRLLGLFVLVVVLIMALLTLGLVTRRLAPGVLYNLWPYHPVLSIARDVAHPGSNHLPFMVGGAVGIGLLCLWAILSELRPPRRVRPHVLALAVDGPGKTTITYALLDRIATRGTSEIEGVAGARAWVEPDGKALTVRCRALITPTTNLVLAGPTMQEAVTARVEATTGFPVNAMTIRIALPRRRRAR